MKIVDPATFKQKLKDMFNKNYKGCYSDISIEKAFQASINIMLDEYGLKDDVEIKVKRLDDNIICNINKAPDWFVEKWKELGLEDE